jgi:hypothetical protein
VDLPNPVRLGQRAGSGSFLRPSLQKGGGLVDAPGRWLVGAKGNYPFSKRLSAHDPSGHPRRMKIRPVVVGTPCRAGVEVGCRLVPLSPSSIGTQALPGTPDCCVPPEGQHA